MQRSVVLALAVSAVVVAGCSHTRSASSTRPSATRPVTIIQQQPASPNAMLPKIEGSITLDGKPDDLAGATSIPMYSAGQIASIEPGRKWSGIADIGAEIQCGWTDAGLAIAAVVRDDDVANTMKEGDLWRQDCFELFVDGRSGKQFMTAPYTPGAYQILVKPPIGGNPPVAFVVQGQRNVEGIQVGGVATAGGYTIEMLIPWSAFPGNAKPADVALGFQIDDYDIRDTSGMRTVTLAVPTRDDLYKSPANWTAFHLVDGLSGGGNLGPALQIDAPAILAKDALTRVTVNVGSSVVDRVKTVRVAIPGKTIAKSQQGRDFTLIPWTQGSAPVEVSENAGLKTASAVIDLPPAQLPVGAYTLSVVALDASDKPVGVNYRKVVNVGDTVDKALATIDKANVGLVAEADPFKAASWLGAASAVDRLRQAIAQQDAPAVERRMDEVATRLAILQGQPAKGDPAMLHDLLTLTAKPDAEIAVEYPRPDVGTVVFNYGAIPLGSVNVEKRSAADANNPNDPAKRPHAYRTTLKITNLMILNAVVQCIYDNSEPADPATLTPYRDLFVWDSGSTEVQVITPDQLSWIQCDAIVQIVGGHTGPATAAATYADQRGIPTRFLNDLQGAKRVLLVGDPRQVKQFADAKYVRLFPRRGAAQMTVTSGDRILWAIAPTPDIAGRMIKLVLEGKPISANEVDGLRKRIVDAIAPGVKPKPAADLLCGDLHMHTFYSDGNCSPATLMLQAIYTMQDFSVMTDHNTIAGAMRARQLLANSGFAYPQIVGEEFTTKYHSNIFPVESAILPPMEPQELATLVHDQGGFTQWNHPGFPDWGREYLANGMGSIGFDAWEHMPLRYDIWQKEGRNPLFTGTTDTHDGTFGMFPERTIVFAGSADGKSLAQALRNRQAVAVWQDGGELFYGPADCVKKAQAALAEGKALKTAKAQHIREALRKSKPATLVQESETSKQE